MKSYNHLGFITTHIRSGAEGKKIMLQYIQLIDSFLREEISYSSFYSTFNDLLIDSRTDSLSENEAEFVDEINERLFFVGESPSEEEGKKYEYIDQYQFRNWLREVKEKNIRFWPAREGSINQT